MEGEGHQDPEAEAIRLDEPADRPHTPLPRGRIPDLVQSRDPALLRGTTRNDYSPF